MKVIAHRGLSEGSFENSLSAILAAIVEGVDYIEIDIRKTMDGHLILFHDPYYDRLTNYSGLVALNNTPSELGIKLNNGEDIPLLSTIIGVVKLKVPLIVEIKNEDAFSETYDLLASTMLPDDFVIVSFFHLQIMQLKQQHPSVRTGVILEAVLLDFPQYLSAINPDFVILSIDTYTDQQIQEIKSQDRKLVFYGVNHLEELKSAVEIDAYGIITNYPEKAKKFLKDY